MPFLSNWRTACLALCLVALAFPSSLKAQDGVVEVDFGNITTNLNSVRLYIDPIFTVYGGCMDTAHKSYYVQATSMTTRELLPQSASQRTAIATGPLRGQQGGGPFVEGEAKVVSFEVPYTLQLTRGGSTILDSQTIIFKIRANVTLVAGSGEWTYTRNPRAVVTLKSGGPSPGKTRTPQLPPEEEPEEPEDMQEIDIFTDNTDYYIEPGTGRVMPNEIPSYDIGGHQGKFPNGAGWMKVSVPASSVSNGAVPSGLSSAYPNAGHVGTSPSGNPAYMASNRKSGGQSRPAFTGGSVTQGADGTTHVNGWGDATGTDMHLAFPPGYEPLKKDPPEPEEPEVPNTLDTDPCFAFANDAEGLPPPGVQPGGPTGPPPGVTPGPTVPLPPGMTPGGGLPLPPEFTPIGGGDPPPSPNPGTPSSGGGAGGGGGLIGGGGGGGGGPTDPRPEPPGPDPDPDPDPDPTGPELPTGPAGGPLPDVGAAESEADGMARSLSEKVGQIEAKAKRFMNWGSVTPFNTGGPADWTITLPINGHNHVVAIPTEHAPIIRGLLLLMVTAMFIVSVFKLLLS